MNRKEIQRMAESMSGSAEQLKNISKTSIDMLNTVITPQMEHKLPDEIKKLVKDVRNSTKLSNKGKPVDVSVKRKEVDNIISEINEITKSYGG